MRREVEESGRGRETNRREWEESGRGRETGGRELDEKKESGRKVSKNEN